MAVAIMLAGANFALGLILHRQTQESDEPNVECQAMCRQDEGSILRTVAGSCAQGCVDVWGCYRLSSHSET